VDKKSILPNLIPLACLAGHNICHRVAPNRLFLGEPCLSHLDLAAVNVQWLACGWQLGALECDDHELETSICRRYHSAKRAGRGDANLWLWGRGLAACFASAGTRACAGGLGCGLGLGFGAPAREQETSTDKR